ncbi:hypothetical protein AMTRI_Chr04g189490 [Amborella trichopoda]
MGQQPKRGATSSPPPSPPPLPPPPGRPPISLLQPSQRKRSSKSTKVYRLFRSVFRSFPILTPSNPCRLSPLPPSSSPHLSLGSRITGTLFGHRKGRVSLSIQENPRCLPTAIIELAMQTNSLLKEMASGLVRIALETEKKAADKTKLLDEPLWSMYCNGRKAGYGVRREAAEEDLGVMQMLQAVSMGAGVLPTASGEGEDGEMTYMRAHFERGGGSRDSEAFYMLNPDGNGGPELSIFFVRI